jgi:YD repeat-containing protein
MIMAVWFFCGLAVAQETAPSARDPGAAKKLFDLPDASADTYAAVEGKWTLVQDTDAAERPLRVKTHHGGKTTVTTYDAKGNILSQHNSEYKLKSSGMARIFVFFNVIPATGPSKGRTMPGPFYYACSVRDDRFLEVYGLLAGDDRSPRVLRWKRVPE